MATFKDTEGREWEICVSQATVKRFRSLKNIDLLDILTDEETPFSRMLVDTSQLVDVLWLLIEKQAAAKNVSQDEFDEVMLGEVVEKAEFVLLESISDFYHDPRLRELSRKKIEAMRELIQHGILEAAAIDVVGMVKDAIDFATNSPESSE